MEIGAGQNIILSEDERLRLRKQRFESNSSNLNTAGALKVLEEEKLKILERQKKFGVITELPEMEEERKRQRSARFGLNDQQLSTGGMSVEDEERKKKRAERFGFVNESDALQKRAQRFKNELDVTSESLNKVGLSLGNRSKKFLRRGRRGLRNNQNKFNKDNLEDNGNNRIRRGRRVTREERLPKRLNVSRGSRRGRGMGARNRRGRF